MGVKVDEMNKTVTKSATRPPLLSLTTDNVRLHTDSQEQETLEKSGGLLNGLPSQYQMEEKLFDAVEEKFFDAVDALPSARDRDDGKATQKIRDKLYQQFTASNALFICEQLNEVAGEVPVVGTIIGALTLIFEKVEAAEANKDACENLGMRVFELSCSLKDLLTEIKHISTLAPSLLSLKNKLTEAAGFIETFSSRGWLSKMFRSGSDASKFEGFENDLTKIIGDAQLAVLGKMMILESRHYQVTQNINKDVKTLIEELGGVQVGCSDREATST